MKNFISSGDVLPMTAPYALTSGDMFLVGSTIAVASDDAASGADVEGRTVGNYGITKKAGDAPAQWAKLYWDNTNKYLTVTGPADGLAGVASVAAAGGDATVACRLNGISV